MKTISSRPAPRTYWIVVDLGRDERHVFRSRSQALDLAKSIGNCEVFPSTLWRKSSFLVGAAS